MNTNTSPPDQHEERLAGAFRSSMFWNIANMGVSQVVTTAVFIYLTYKLDAAVFGIFALGVVVIDYFNFQARSASVDAVLQRRQFDDEALDSVFWASSLIILIVTIFCFFTGGLLAASTNEPKLQYVLPALALTLLPLPFSLSPNAVLMRDHDFKGVALRSIVAALAGCLAAILTVLSSFPEWALVAQRGVNVLVSTVFLMLRARWWPGMNLSLSYATGFLADTGRIFAAQGIANSYMRILDVIVGVAVGAAAVGYMRIAARFIDAIYGAFAAPIGSLWVILLSEGTQTKEQMSKMYLRLTQMSSLICLPVFAGIALTSSDLVELALNDDYAAVAPILMILGIAGLFAPIVYFRNAALTAIRRLNLLLAFSIFDLAIVTASALAIVYIKTDVSLIVGSLVVLNAVRVVQTMPVLLKEMSTKLSSFIMCILPAYIAVTVMGAAVLGITPYISDLPVLARLALKSALGAGAYFGYLLIMHKDWSETAISMLWKRNKTVPAD